MSLCHVHQEQCKTVSLCVIYIRKSVSLCHVHQEHRNLPYNCIKDTSKITQYNNT